FPRWRPLLGSTRPAVLEPPVDEVVQVIDRHVVVRGDALARAAVGEHGLDVRPVRRRKRRGLPFVGGASGPRRPPLRGPLGGRGASSMGSAGTAASSASGTVGSGSSTSGSASSLRRPRFGSMPCRVRKLRTCCSLQPYLPPIVRNDRPASQSAFTASRCSSNGG